MAQTDGTTRAQQDGGQPRLLVNGPLAETQRMSTEEIEERRQAVENGSAGAGYAYGANEGAHDVPGHHDVGDTDGDFDEEFGEGGIFEWLWEHWYVPVGAVAAFLLVVILLGGVFGGSGEEPAAPAPAPETAESADEDASGGDAGAPFGAAGLEVRDTGVVIEEPVERDDGTYYVRAGEIAWKGKKEATDTGQQFTLEGPTAAQFKNSVTLPHGSITTGVFGRAAPGKPMFHATFHRTTIGEEEITTGTYHALDGSRVIVEGTYSDTRDGNTVTRTYSEAAPGSGNLNRYAVSFEAPPGALVPVLVGWEPPAEVEEDEAA